MAVVLVFAGIGSWLYMLVNGQVAQLPNADPTWRVQAFYYGWYGNPQTDGQWRHWNDKNHLPADDIDSAYYPQLGAYSSADRTVVAQHMKWARQAGIGVLIYSWWGRNNYMDHNAALVLEEAAKQNIQIAWIMEPYAGRTPASVVSDIHYIYDTYGQSLAFFRVSRPTKYGNTTTSRGLFYVYQSTSYTDKTLAGSWRAALDGLHADTTYNAIVLGTGEDACFVDGCNDLTRESHFDGLFVYAGSPVFALGYATMKSNLDARNSIFVPTAIPGYDSSRDRAGDPQLPRFNTNYCASKFTYDCEWESIAAAKPEWTSITSFNEWHESTIIEPAVPKTIPSFTYRNFTNELSSAAPTFYLDKTAAGVSKYLASLGITWSPPTVPGAPAPTSSPASGTSNATHSSNTPGSSPQSSGTEPSNGDASTASTLTNEPEALDSNGASKTPQDTRAAPGETQSKSKKLLIAGAGLGGLSAVVIGVWRRRRLASLVTIFRQRQV